MKRAVRELSASAGLQIPHIPFRSALKRCARPSRHDGAAEGHQFSALSTDMYSSLKRGADEVRSTLHALLSLLL